MMPLAPARLSTRMRWPTFSATRSATRRVRMSAGPPAGNGTIQRIGFVGKFSACAAHMQSRSTAAATAFITLTIARMNVLYEEDGALKVGAVLADNVTSLQVEAPHGRRAKIKAAAVLLRFDDPPLGDYMAQARRLGEEIDVDFLWECSSGEDFGFEDLAREYYGHAPSAL